MQITKTFFFCILLIIALSAQKGSSGNVPGADFRFSEGSIYMFCRGTLSKAGMIAREFNQFDTNTTHVGVGFYTGNKLLIYHVSDVRRGGRSLLVDSLESFTGVEDIRYLSIWACRNSPAELEKLKQVCASYGSRKIWFDPYFNLRNDDTLYCSEFCVAVLQQVNRDKFSFPTRTIPISNSFYQSYLRRDQLTYYPVDFFQQNPYFRKVMEKRYKH
jgi:hypothetical protein